MNRILFAVFVLGTFLAHHGYQEYKLAQGATQEPIDVSLSEIEAGHSPDNPHLRVGEHWRMYQELVFSYRTDEDVENEEPGQGQKLDYSYYPILAVDNPFFREVTQLEKLYGDVDSIPDDQFPERIEFAVLVRSDEFASLDRLPDPAWTVSDSVQGLVVNQIRKLSDEERQLVAEGFPTVDLDSLLILEQGRRPSSVTTSYAFMGGGAALAVLPIVGFVVRGQSRSKEEEEPGEEAAFSDAPGHDELSGRTDPMGEGR